MIRERKCLRSFGVRTELGDKQLNHKEVELDNHICIVRGLKRDPEIQQLTQTSLKRKEASKSDRTLQQGLLNVR